MVRPKTGDRRPTILALANQKGGVAKTTSVASLGAAFVELGKRVLLIDLDPQACLTFSLGIDPDTVETSIHEVLTQGAPIADAVLSCDEGVDLVPSTIDLAGAEAMLMPRPGREYVLRTALQGGADDEADPAAYDIILIDCSPSLGVLTLNALTAADALIVPMPAEMLSHRGVGQLLDTVADPARARGAGRRRRTLRRAGPRTAYPEDDPLRGGAGGRAVHSLHGSDVQGRAGLP